MLHVLVLAAWLAPLGTSSGPSAPSVAIVTRCHEAAEVAQVLTWLSVEASQRGWTVSAPTGDGEAARTPCAKLALRRATESFSSARFLFEEKLRHDAAKLELEQALAQFETASSLLGAPDLYSQVRFYLGWIDFELGRHRQCEEHFEAAIRSQTAWRPLTNRFPPAATEKFRQVAAQMKRARRGRLLVRSEPVGASVLVGGVEKCTTPCTVAKLLPGEHFVQVRRFGYAPVDKRVRLAAGGKRTLKIQLRRDAREWLLAMAEGRGSTEPSELLKRLGIDAAIVLTIGSKPGDVGLFVVASGLSEASLRATVQTPDFALHARGLVHKALPVAVPPTTTSETSNAATADHATAGPAATGDAEVQQQPRSLLRKWWFWAAVGGVILAVGTTGAVLAADRDDKLYVTVRP